MIALISLSKSPFPDNFSNLKFFFPFDAYSFVDYGVFSSQQVTSANFGITLSVGLLNAKSFDIPFFTLRTRPCSVSSFSSFLFSFRYLIFYMNCLCRALLSSTLFLYFYFFASFFDKLLPSEAAEASIFYFGFKSNPKLITISSLSPICKYYVL